MLGIAFNALRVIVLRVRYGKRLQIKKIRQCLSFDTEIRVGKDAFLSIADVNTGDNVHLVCEHGEMNIGGGVIFTRNCNVICWQKIDIGNGCLFGPNVCVYDHDHKFSINGVSLKEFDCSDIVIEDGCWIGAGVIILRGTHIGRNSVIGAGTVVKGNIPPDSLVFSSRETKTIPLRFFKSKNRKDG